MKTQRELKNSLPPGAYGTWDDLCRRFPAQMSGVLAFSEVTINNPTYRNIVGVKLINGFCMEMVHYDHTEHGPEGVLPAEPLRKTSG